MANVAFEQSNLIGGVSQQAPTMRLKNQAEAIDNCWLSPVAGLVRRMPTQHVADLGSVVSVSKYHTIYRDASEQYQLVVTASGVSAYSLADGSAATISDPGTVGYGYLSGITDADDLKLMTVGDTTFVVNTKKTVAMSSSTTGALEEKAFLFLRQGNYSSHYNVTVNYHDGTTDQSISVETITWDGVNTTPGFVFNIGTDEIMENVETKLNATIVGTDFTLTRYGSIIMFDADPGVTITSIEATDPVGETAFAVVYREVPRVEGWLPEVCENDFKVKVVGDAEVDADDYWVIFETDEPSGFGRGVWKETIGPSAEYELDAATMPHILVNTGTGTFDWRRPDWGDRTVGDEESNKDPSFVGRTLDNQFFYKDRLGFLSGPNVIMSETGEYYNFFRITLLSLRDTARIDVTSTHTKVTNFKSAVPYNEDMLLFTDRTQFILPGGDVLSPRTVEIVAVSEYESSIEADPVPTARSVFFPFSRLTQSGVRELFQVGDVTNFDGADITVQVPNYIEGTIEYAVASALEDALLVLTDEPEYVYVYKYLWSGGQRVQSAWSRWDFGDDVLHFDFVDSTLYLLINRNGKVMLEKLSVTVKGTDGALPYLVYLDRRITDAEAVSVVYNAGPGTTTITMPFSVSTGTWGVVDRDTGEQYVASLVAGTTITVQGDVSAKNLFIGRIVTQQYDFSPPLVKMQDGSGARYGVPQRVGMLHLQYENSIAFTVQTTLGNRSPYDKDFSSDDPEDGEFTAGIYGPSGEVLVSIINTTPYPANIITATWEILYQTRAGRLRG